MVRGEQLLAPERRVQDARRFILEARRLVSVMRHRALTTPALSD